jgi:hypothetical protein
MGDLISVVGFLDEVGFLMDTILKKFLVEEGLLVEVLEDSEVVALGVVVPAEVGKIISKNRTP